MIVQLVIEGGTRKVRWTCRCGEVFTRTIPEEVFFGAKQKSLGLASVNEGTIQCMMIVKEILVTCPNPKCKNKFDLMTGKLKPEATKVEFDIRKCFRPIDDSGTSKEIN